MYDVTVVTPEFEGISIVKQHRMVTEVSLTLTTIPILIK